ncbi:MAG: ABC transporter ATP-binding protein [Epulopiscium sp.]|nr:ABC transporter ATP-binding protein [Candidatus Epulonipiscium sp.]
MRNELEIRNLDVFYKKRHIVKNIGLTMGTKEFNALLGRNGCGKTTLLKGILGLIKTEGNILLNGASIPTLGVKEKAKSIGYISQRTDVTYSIGVKDLILMGLNPHLGTFEQIDKHQELKVIDIAKELGIEKFLNKDYLTLSEGQKQLVIIARAIVQDASLLLLDEPDSAMDFVVRHIILQKLKEILILHNKMALITMHDPNFALSYCDNIFLMKDGGLLETIRVKEDGIKEIKRKLRLIYGEIDLIEYKGSFYMVKA